MRGITLLLMLAGARAVAEPQPTLSHGEMSLWLDANGSPMQSPVEVNAPLVTAPATPPYQSWTVSAGATGTWFAGRPLVDDDAPLALQPYLQRATELAVSASGGALLTTYQTYTSDVAAPAPPTPTYSADFGGVNLSANGYADWVFIAGSFGWSHELVTLPAPPAGSFSINPRLSSDVLSPSLTLGWRLDALRVDVSWNPHAIHGFVGSWRGRLNEAALGAHWVGARKRLWLAASAFLLDGGGGGTVDAEWFFTPRLGLLAGVLAENGAIYLDSDTRSQRYSGRVSVGWWVTRRIEVELTGEVVGTERAADNTVPQPAFIVAGLGEARLVARLP
jgi:hypothetical protein